MKKSDVTYLESVSFSICKGQACSLCSIIYFDLMISQNI